MKLIVLPCDHIGPEISSAAVEVLQTASDKFDLGLTFDYEIVGFESLEKFGTSIRDEVIERCRDYDGIILAPQGNADYPPLEEGGRNVSATFRVGLDVFANVRPARTRSFLPSHMRADKTMDLVIMRECTEGFYADRNMTRGSGEMMPSPDMALAIRKITRHCSERIAREGFALAMKRRKKFTAIHKANCFIMSCGLFLEACRHVGKDFPDVEYEELLVDAAAAHIVRRPADFDVVCCTNFFGDILSDMCSELSGSLGLAGSINASDKYCVAQAQHGSAPDIAGQNIANPTSMILSCAMLLEWLSRKHDNTAFAKAATAIEQAVDTVLEDPAKRTRDLNGQTNCDTFGHYVSEALAA